MIYRVPTSGIAQQKFMDNDFPIPSYHNQEHTFSLLNLIECHP